MRRAIAVGPGVHTLGALLYQLLQFNDRGDKAPADEQTSMMKPDQPHPVPRAGQCGASLMYPTSTPCAFLYRSMGSLGQCTKREQLCRWMQEAQGCKAARGPGLSECQQ